MVCFILGDCRWSYKLGSLGQGKVKVESAGGGRDTRWLQHNLRSKLLGTRGQSGFTLRHTLHTLYSLAPDQSCKQGLTFPWHAIPSSSWGPSTAASHSRTCGTHSHTKRRHRHLILHPETTPALFLSNNHFLMSKYVFMSMMTSTFE